jgi:hypothetical protein
MRGTKAKQARRIIKAAGADLSERRYGITPWGQVVTTGARNFYQHLKRELRGRRGTNRHTTMAGARPDVLEQRSPTS